MEKAKATPVATATPATSYAVTLATFQSAQRFAMYLVKTNTLTDTKLITALNACTVSDDMKDDKTLVYVPTAYYRTVKSASFGFKYKLTNKNETAETIAKQEPITPKMPIKSPKAPTIAPTPRAPKATPKAKTPDNVLDTMSTAEITALMLKAVAILQAQTPKQPKSK